MYYSDYHLHSQLSDDSHATLEQQCRTAIAQGISEICVTDHWNMVGQEGNPLPRTYDWAATRKLILETRDQFFGQLDIRMGIELGNSMLDSEAVRQALPQGELDFVIGSLHNMSETAGAKGIYTIGHIAQSAAACAAVMDDYMDTLDDLAHNEPFDVMGHIIYPIRYFPRQYNISLDPYWDRVESLLRTLIEQGRGIELNTSQGSTINDWVPILKRYRQLGGEIITTGADSHFNEKVGAGIKDATQLIADMGFRYTTVFRQRVPMFVRL